MTPAHANNERAKSPSRNRVFAKDHQLGNGHSHADRVGARRVEHGDRPLSTGW